MPTGRVNWFSISKGYGFILENDGAELFVHRSEIQNVEYLDEGRKFNHVGQGKRPLRKRSSRSQNLPFNKSRLRNYANDVSLQCVSRG